jgi:Tc toxin complex TcA C-terminal TcB-binding domain
MNPHGHVLEQVAETPILAQLNFATKQRYRFHAFYHPYVCAFINELNRHGVDGMLQRPVQIQPEMFAPVAPGKSAGVEPLVFRTKYEPDGVSPQIVEEPYPKENVDFEEDGAYAQYNWELFFHAPLLIADRLGKNQRHEHARRWFHFIFDPTDMSGAPAPQRYWRTKPFFERTREGYEREHIVYILKLLAAGADPQQEAQLTAEEKEDLARFEKAVARWQNDPFKPHLVARLRTTAFQKTVVMKYLDNLIAWGDQLFRRDTLESINEATQLYVLAAEILGRKPETVPARARPRVQTYNTLEPHLDVLGNALVQIEDFIEPSALPVSAADAPAVPTLPAMLYFCVPKNDKLLGYWDIVADRLFKIRHCMNIEGVVRQLPLFEPPIDPALLVKAAAAGVDLESVLDDVSAAVPLYRFNVLAQKATELCGEVKALGAATLAALEKRDAEVLALLRAQHETSLLAAVEAVKSQQLKEAEQNLVALRASRQMPIGRWLHFQKLLGVQSPQVPKEGDNVPEVAASAHMRMEDEDGVKMIPFESEELYQLEEALQDNERASALEIAANVVHVIPEFAVASKPFGLGIEVTTGGTSWGLALSALASRYRFDATEAGHMATEAAKLAGYALRGHDHVLQTNQAAREIMQIDKQIIASELRVKIATKELANHRQQMEDAQKVEETLRDKYTNQELYGWMLGQLASVHFQSYQLAYDLARKAERAFRHELGVKDSNFIQFGYWDSLKKGLLAGERLSQNLKRMEVAYLDKHRREFEVTKHVSIAQLDPLALVMLRQTGVCVVSLPEALFDLDYPGHYMRRIKSVSVSIPCVAGPYAGVSCTLSLLRSSVRHSEVLGGDKKYARQDEDRRFTDSMGAIQSIATSSGQNDTGMFELNFRDERFLPFEGAGAISEWRIELPTAFRPFDYDTIADVVLHVKYTARAGGGVLAQQATNELEGTLNEYVRTEGQTGLARLLSVRHELPTAWHQFLNPGPGGGIQKLSLPLGRERFPFIFNNKKLTIGAIEFFLKVKPEFATTHNESTIKLVVAVGTEAPTPENANAEALLALAPWAGMLRAARTFEDPAGVWTVHAWREGGETQVERIDATALEDLILICHYTVAP